MKVEIWAEGYEATGESSGAQRLWAGEAKDFDDAILIYEKELTERYGEGTNNKIDRYEGDQAERSKYGIWACRLFDNEADARKAFG